MATRSRTDLARTEPRFDADPDAVGGANPDVTAMDKPPAASLPTASVSAEPVADTPARTPEPRLDQLSRVEDKTARIEEKFARSEERMMRVESALEKATLRLEGATQDMNLQGMRDDIVRLRDQVSRKPGAVTIFILALVAALIGAAIPILFARFGSLLPF